MCEICGHEGSKTRAVTNNGKWYKEVDLCDPCANALAANRDLDVVVVNDGTTGTTLPSERGMRL